LESLARDSPEVDGPKETVVPSALGVTRVDFVGLKTLEILIVDADRSVTIHVFLGGEAEEQPGDRDGHEKERVHEHERGLKHRYSPSAFHLPAFPNRCQLRGDLSPPSGV